MTEETAKERLARLDHAGSVLQARLQDPAIYRDFDYIRGLLLELAEALRAQSPAPS